MDHSMLARVLSKNAEIIAISIEVDAMKAANVDRLSRGESLAYPAGEFSQLADQVRGISIRIISIIFLMT